MAARGGLLVLAVALASCTVITTESERPRPPIEVDPRPEAGRDVGGLAAAIGPVREFEEVRALWVVRFTMTSAEAVRDMVEAADRAGINTLIVQVRGRGDAFYLSEIEPLAESMRGPSAFDPLQLTIDEAHRRGMAVHAWVNTHLLWGPTNLPESPQHIVNAHPDWLAVPRDLAKELAGVDPFAPRYVAALIQYARDRPRTVEGVYSSPSHPRVHDRDHGVWMDLTDR